MNKKVEIPENAKIQVVWNVLPYDYTKENEKALITLTAKKYGIPERQVEVMPHVLSTTGADTDNAEIKKELSDLCNTENQLALFKKYLEAYKVEGYDWETIKAIDGDVNSQINYEKYSRYKKYKLKWIKWDNFLSYGEGNFFDFEKLKGLVLMNGVPANQTGKTSFAIDLIHFLLFGHCTPTKASTNADVFNWNTKSTQVKVEGCINIDGQDYVIRRTLTRPKNFTAKSKVSGTLEYFRVDGDNNYSTLRDYDSSNADVSLNEESVAQTNKVIKDAIGKETDFDMIICATAKSLSDLVDNTGNTERGQMMTRWLGLDVIGDKEQIAKGIYSQQMGNAMFKTKNVDVLKQDNELKNKEINSNKDAIKIIEGTIDGLNTTIADKEKECETLQSSKTTINQELLKLDKVTIQTAIDQIIDKGKEVAGQISQKETDLQNKDSEINAKQKEIEQFGKVELADDAFQIADKEFTEANTKYTQLIERYNKLVTDKKALQNSEYCPTCRQRLQNVDNSALIAQCDVEIETVKKAGAEARKEKDDKEAVKNQVNALLVKKLQLQRLFTEKQTLENEKNKIILSKQAYETNRSDLRLKYQEQTQLMKDYEANKDAIEKNAEMDRLILNKKNELEGYRRSLSEQTISKGNLERDNEDLQKKIDDNNADIIEIQKEIELDANWQIYLTMLGKNGVAKMEVRELTPIINIKLRELLSDVADFDVEVEVTEKNEIAFKIITQENGEITRANLSAGSGFESTVASLALRYVLSTITSIPQPNFFVLDEVIGGGVASENYDKIKKLFDKMLVSKNNGVDFILHCTHIDDVKDWHKSIITIIKKNRISSVSHATLG